MAEFNIALQFEKLLEVKLAHTYYANGLSSDFVFEPDADAVRELRNMRLLFKTTPTGFVILYSANNEATLVKRLKTHPLLLSFVIQLKTPLFSVFSDLPFFTDRRAYYFNNLNVGQNKNKKTVLHEDNFVGEAKQKYIHFRPLCFDYEFEEPLTEKDWNVTDFKGKKIDLFADREVDGKNKKQRHKIDLRGQEGRKFSLEYSKKKGIAFDFYTMQKTFFSCFGMLDLLLSDQLPKTAQLTDGKKLLKPIYYLQFNARSTYWKYFVINQQDVKYKDFEIVSSDEKEIFANLGAMELADKSKEKNATILCSKKQIPLREFALNEYQLKLKRSGKNTQNTINLPVPGIKTIKPDKTDRKKIYSEIYIYI